MASSIEFFGATVSPGEKADAFLAACDSAMKGYYDSYYSDGGFSGHACVSSYGTVTLETEGFFEYDGAGDAYENAVMGFIKKYPDEDFRGYYASIDTSCGGLDYYSYTYHGGVLRIEHRYPKDEDGFDYLSISEIQEICHTDLKLSLARKCGVSANCERWKLVNGKWE